MAAMADEHTKLPVYVHEPRQLKSRRLSRGLRVVLAIALSLVAFQYFRLYSEVLGNERENVQVPLRAAEWLDKCQLLNVKPGPPEDFNARTRSDRFVPGTQATLITVRGYLRPTLVNLLALTNATAECYNLDWARGWSGSAQGRYTTRRRPYQEGRRC